MQEALRILRQRFYPEQGVITIEFSFVFIIFVFFVFLIFEINRFMYVSASLDLTLSEAARITSRTEKNQPDYGALFAANIHQESKFWSAFVDPKEFSLKVTYCSSVSRAVNGNCSSGTGNQFPLAVYSAGYRYRPWLFSLDNGSAMQTLFSSLDTMLNRRLVYVQEYERGD